MPECGISLRRRGAGESRGSRRGTRYKEGFHGAGTWPRQTGGQRGMQDGHQGSGVTSVVRAGRGQSRQDITWSGHYGSREGSVRAQGGSPSPPGRLRYSQESRTLLALSWRRGLRGLGLQPRAVRGPGARAAPPPAGILGLPPTGHSGGGGGRGRSGPAPVPSSPQHAAASGPRRRRRVRLQGMLLELL